MPVSVTSSVGRKLLLLCSVRGDEHWDDRRERFILGLWQTLLLAVLEGVDDRDDEDDDMLLRLLVDRDAPSERRFKLFIIMPGMIVDRYCVNKGKGTMCSKRVMMNQPTMKDGFPKLWDVPQTGILADVFDVGYFLKAENYLQVV